ncbi:hypothetical protein [Solidesulfovibrio sp.]|jgi:hypothetical protein|uniref:hypothetical protein n=1 Tax=Solidesulfovibrio sp. TaxID=2910990 RepID=UPI000ECBBF24|nr:hypothetical protein [Solidesulfovibrio sp.]MEA5090771.1 hypothetical protein [Solidesulfovibrio sp.]HCR13987.1 hypothetical protein [Desulfovibrio sp.]HML62405.1 hypothetical protein [Solidesulfovibrio sp.]
MRSLALFVVCHLLFASVSFAGDTPSDAEQTRANTPSSKKSEYKSSPRLNYSSNKPKDEDNSLGTLKPMLDQAFGNKDGAGGGVMPNAGTYKF